MKATNKIPAETTEDSATEQPTTTVVNWPRRHWKIIVIALTILTLAILSWAAYAMFAPQKSTVTLATTTPKPTPSPSPTPKLSASPLTGELVDPALANRPIVSVIIENHPDARPQSGLADAGVAYEALAEGGITRFQAFFLDKAAATIGPVRSLRTYFVDWALEFSAPVAHAGGNIDAIDLIAPLGLKSLNALVIGTPTFYRTSDRYAPHNLYTSSKLLDNLLVKRNYNQPANFTASPRKADTPMATPSNPNIHIDYSYNGYQVDYTYTASTNDYARSLDGAAHVDRNYDKQIHVKNVVVEFMPTSYGYTRANEQTVIMATVGQGRALVFRDGGVVEGTWSKASHNARTLLKDANGVEIPLNIGNTWYSIVPTDKTVNY